MTRCIEMILSSCLLEALLVLVCFMVLRFSTGLGHRCWDGAGTVLGRCWDGAGTVLGRYWDGAGTVLGR